MLMIPNMHKIAGELLPGVIHVSSRSISRMTTCLYCDYGDVFQTRAVGMRGICYEQAGFAYLSAHSVQEAHDMALIAHLSAQSLYVSLTCSIESSVPFVHFFDGFRTSHEMASIELISPEDIKSIFPFEKALEHKNRGTNPTHPNSIGVAYGDDVWMQACQSHKPYYDAVPEKVQAAMDKVAKVSGRQYHLFDYV